MRLSLSSGPHIRAKSDTRLTMLDVLIALLPTTAAGIYFFGARAAMVLAVSVASCVLFEALWCALGHEKSTVGDLSAAVTGLLLGLNLPSNAPWWMPVIGAAFAILIIKQLFGGMGANFLNPALAARAALLSSWPAHMTTFLLPQRTLFVHTAEVADAATAATPLTTKSASYLDLFLGNIPGCIGEVCKVALLIGLVYLLVRKVIGWQIPVVMVATVALLSWALGEDPLAAVLSGGVLLGAIFMATDYVTSPMLAIGECIYAFGCGLILVLIRKYGNYPEGCSYAILIMNIITPLIDKYCKRKVYGEVKKNA